jgi:glycosyltransferase involved in cell wall biosynthesis
MKLLHVSPSMDPKHGGVCQAVRMIISGLQELAVHNEVVSLDDPQSDFLKDEKFTINAIGIASGPWSYNAHLVPWVVENISRFDAVIVHGLWLYYGYAVRKAIAASTANTRLFVMPHGMLDPYFQRAPGRRIKALRNNIYWKFIEGKLINSADGVLFTCEEECRLARQPFRPYRPKRELVVGLGADQPPAYTKNMDVAFRAKVPGLMSSSYILFLSRIHEKKGVDLLVNAYAELKNKMVESQGTFPKLVVAGPGLETSYGQEIKRLAYDMLGLQSYIFFPGMLIGDSKWGAFYGCEAFVLPSHQENFGIAVIEALGCGKAVLISNQVNIWREIDSAGGGLVDEDTLAGTRQILEQWLNFSSEEKKQMGQRGVNCFKNAFSKGPASKRFLQAMNSK